MKLLLVLLPCVLLAGPKAVRYNCPAGQTFDVAYPGNRAEVSIPGKPKLKLPSISTFSFSDGFTLLSLKGPEATFASGTITLANCLDSNAPPQTSTKVMTPSLSPLGKWELATLAGQPVTLKQPATLNLADGGASGFAGCNKYNGGYTSSGNALTFASLNSTKMACEGDRMKIETGLFNALGKTASFSLDAATLTLLNAAGQPLATLRKL
jgi:heat shock protein HslJ